MKKCNSYKSFAHFRYVLVLFLMLCAPLIVAAQVKKVTGTVTDETGETVIGAVVKISDTTIGTTTDVDGKYSIDLPQGKNQLEFSFLGYETQIVVVTDHSIVNIKLEPKAQLMTEVVVIGYGTQVKKDLTGSVSVVSAKDFNKGLVSSPEQLINGKISGVQIVSGGGSPTSGSTIRIRGGASLNASNDPLIVLDGVPLEIGGISGNDGNFLSLINPSDIESMTVLKDASSTAIYGSRASNGVIIITTKKGSNDRIKVSFSTTNSIQTRTKSADMLSESEFRDLVNTKGTTSQKSLIGTASTDWNDEIFKTAFGTDNNLSVAGSFVKNFPFRVSLGLYNQDGILRTDNAQRYTGSISLNPSFLQDHLKFNLNLKGSSNKNRFADAAAVWNAATYNPTIPVYSGTDAYGGYNEAIDADGKPVTNAVLNPLGHLMQRDSKSTVNRLITNFDVDYKLHFLPELRAHITLGYDYAKGKGDIYVPAEAIQYYTSGGRDYTYGPQKKTNRLFTSYLNYNKQLKEIKSTLDVTAGYDYQFWKSTSSAYEELNVAGVAQASTAATDQRHVLLSYYGRVNYAYDHRYLLTVTMRRDGTSRFNKDNRWGTFPSVALAWRMTEEAFMKDNNVLSDLKFRLSYGVTGQQDGIGNYNYLPMYTQSQDGARYRLGNEYYYTYRPQAYDANLKWETTKSYNIGLDFGFLNNRISGSVDYYTRKTEDLLANVPTAAGTNFDKTIITNVGNVDSQGLELSISATPIETQDFSWNVAFNATYQHVKIKNLSLVQGAQVLNTPAGPTIDNTYLQVLTEGYAPYTFYVYKQLYDESGKPIEGQYADLDGSGDITSDDLYHYKSPAPDVILGFNTSFQYKQWTLGMGFRANLGNYVYNGMAMNTGAWNTMSYNDFQLNNLNRSYLKTGFESRQHLSDYYVENASFLKMDNLSLGYNFGQVNKNFRMSVSAMVQNVFTWTKYSGVDPEVGNGLDSSFYPRPRTFSLSLGLEF